MGLSGTKKDGFLVDGESITWAVGTKVDAFLVEVSPNPVITSLHPDIGSEGDRMRIKGYAFGAIQGSSKVYFGALEATVDTWSATEIACFVPAITDDCNVKVVT